MFRICDADRYTLSNFERFFVANAELELADVVYWHKIIFVLLISQDAELSYVFMNEKCTIDVPIHAQKKCQMNNTVCKC